MTLPMEGKSKVDDLLSRPLYLFQLPNELLGTLTLKSNTFIPQEQHQSSSSPLERKSFEEDQTDLEKLGAGCTTCGISSFTTVVLQREHVRSDFHKFNLKRKVAGKIAVGLEQFDKMIETLNESISGSESTSSTHSSQNDPLSRLFAKQARMDSSNLGSTSVAYSKNQGPLLWFTSPLLSQPTYVGIYRTLLNPSDAPVESIKHIQIKTSAKPRYVALMMIGGGHFAGLIASLNPKVIQGGQGVEERSVNVIATKTFHRYTTRRKQGGGQSAYDNASGKANSAGSSLRRYNEAALGKEIRDLLESWRDMLQGCEMIFVRASGSGNRKTIFYEGGPLKFGDERIRGFPFNTRRPTQKELLRCFSELTRVKVSHLDEASLMTVISQKPPSTTNPGVSSKQVITEEERELKRKEKQAIIHTQQLISLIKRNKSSAMTTYLQQHSLSAADFELQPASQHSHTPTLLHFAAASAQPGLVLHLMASLGADPTRKNVTGRTSFELSSDRATRDAFRVARGKLGEEKWDWAATTIPSPISEAEANRRAEDDLKEKEAAQKIIQRENELVAKEALKNTPSGNKRSVANSGTMVGEATEDKMRGLTPEMRIKIMREQRARAAEARILKQSQKKTSG